MERRISVLFPTSVGTIKNIGNGRPDLIIFDHHNKYDELFVNEKEMEMLIATGGERYLPPNGVGVVEIKTQNRITNDAIRQTEK